MESMQQGLTMKTKHVVLSDIKKFDCDYWLICLLSLIEKMMVGPFLAAVPALFLSKYDVDPSSIPYIVAIPSLSLVLFSTTIGIAFDIRGKRCHFLVLAYFFLFLSQSMLYLEGSDPDLLEPYLGVIAVCLITAASIIIQLTMYTSINYIVKEKYFGLAYGILQSINNLGITLGALIVSYLLHPIPFPISSIGKSERHGQNSDGHLISA